MLDQSHQRIVKGMSTETGAEDLGGSPHPATRVQESGASGWRKGRGSDLEEQPSIGGETYEAAVGILEVEGEGPSETMDVHVGCVWMCWTANSADRGVSVPV